MGVALGDLISRKEVDISYFKDKIIAIDAMNMLYQFATTIRQADGTPLKNSKGEITSHLTGLFSRISRFISSGLKLVFVFDGEMPELKRLERERREKLKTEAISSFEDAKERGDVLEMKKFASRTTRVTKEMVSEAVELINAFGLPIIMSPAEGEAQASYMVTKGDANFVASQDFDCLIYGAPKIVRNLSISNKRKKINALTYKTVLPEILTLKDVLNELEITRNQLIALSMLVGTDFNIGGIKGLGPKKSLKLVKENGEDFEKLFSEVKFDEIFGISWKEVFNLIKNMPVTDDYDLKWQKFDRDKIVKLLVDRYEFNLERVETTLEKLEKEMTSSKQTSLGKFF
ncbi:MAG: flap endonuclease-1 [Candidatus Woesearchaeota archaeon]